MVLTHTASSFLANIDCTNIIFDAGDGYGLIIQGNDANHDLTQLNFSNCTFLGGSQGISAVVVPANTDCQSVNFNNCVMYAYRQHGVVLNSTISGQINFTGCNIYHNSLDATRVYSNIVIANGVQNISVTGGNIGGGQAIGSTGITNYGLSIGPTADNILISGVNISRNGIYGLNIGTFGNNVVIENCLDTSGPVTVPCGSTLTLPPLAKLVTVVSGWTLNFDTQTANFQPKEVVTGAGGAFGTIYFQSDSGTAGILTLLDVTGVFVNNETLTGNLGGSALVDGVLSTTTTITNITPVNKDRIIVLKFDGVYTFSDGGNLKLAGSYTTTANDTITLICDGTNWYESSRSGDI
jgi:hypothetical protein